MEGKVELSTIAAMGEHPDGVVTFLLTDIEGSTRLWEEAPNEMMRALEQHDDVIDEVVQACNGLSVKPRGEGDSRFLVFGNACDAVDAAAMIQSRLAAVDWLTPRPLRIRAALHTGTANRQLGDYYGATVNRAARLRATAHGGQTVLSGATWELVKDELPSGITARDMGEHTLKDLTQPEHVYQIVVAGGAEDFPPLRSLSAVPNNLPIQLTDFVGRQTVLAEAKQLLGHTRLLTILAQGGAGKTRLGIQAAAELTGEFPDGVFLIGLADISSSQDITQHVAESLGLALSSDQDQRTQLLTYLVNKRQLLVFDNFEHVIDGASIVTDILRAAPQVKALVTSRTKLNLSGETVLMLSGLETEWDSPDSAFQTGGVQLFVDAAKRASPDFVLAADDLGALSDILRLTGGMPLAILLAAAWVDMLPMREIAAEVGKSLDFLETEMGDVPDRHRSVRAVFEYSLALLAPEERTTFEALSVFRGGFTREAAQAVAGASLRGLANLAGKSLMTPSPEKLRYTVHELLRQYADAELHKDADLATRIDEAHAAFFASVAKESLALWVQCDQPGALALMEDDIDNIRRAWRYYLANGNARAARPFVEGLWWLHEVRGWYPAAMSLFDEALHALDEASNDEDVIKLRHLAGAVVAWFKALVGQPEAGAAAAQVAADTLRGSDDLDADITAAQCLAIALAYLGRTEEMAACTEAAIAVADAHHHPLWSAGMRNWRSFAAVLGGDISTAERLLPETYAAEQRLDEHYFMSWSLWLLAMIATQQGRPYDAIDLHSRQLARCRAIGYMRGTMVALEGLGDANLAAGEFDAARRAYVESLATADKMSMVRDMLGTMTKIARAQARMGRLAEAVELLATVHSDPMSAKQPFNDNTPIRELASRALDELRDGVDPDIYAPAWASGLTRRFETSAKELMAG
jgi:predicted ATPase/class 3 adenylate cyclase